MGVRSDTIYALSSGALPAAIGVVRISGPQARAALQALVGRVPHPRQTMLATIRDPQSRETIDQALVLFFEGPQSETGEDVAELQLHGGRAVIAAVFAVLARMDGLRPAEAGEFTRRAFDNGKLDLTAVEGLADLIHAETELQRRQAMRHLQGLLGRQAEAWRARLIEAMALVEASIDFSDEPDVTDDVVARALHITRALHAEIAAALADSRRGERLREGFVVAITGPPNAGKSTLLNCIARREVAIVSPQAGTTRDVIEVHLDLGGYPVTLIDTAGIRETDDPVEQEGVRRARARAADADVVLWLTESGESPPPGWEGAWTVRTKIDLTKNKTANGAERHEIEPQQGRLAVSAVSSDGVPELLAAIRGYLGTVDRVEPALVVRERQRNLLTATAAALQRASATPAPPEEVTAEELRIAAQALGRLTGRVDVEDILDTIFRDFCIGK